MRNLVMICILAGMLGACGEQVEVPPAHVGKILTKNGFQPDSVPPSKFRLPLCWSYCDRLVLAELSDLGIEEAFQLFMPKDQLNMSFDIRGTFRLRDDEGSINQVFDRVIPREGGVITFTQVFEVYGRQAMRDVVRAAIAEYSINEVASNREAVNAAVIAAVQKGLSHTPISVIRIGLADVQFPDIIVAAKEAAAEREVAIERAVAEKQVALVILERKLEEARMERNIRKEKAQAALEENEIIAKSVTQEYLKWRTLEVLEKIAEGGNAVFVPVEALGTIGLQQRIFSGAPAQ